MKRRKGRKTVRILSILSCASTHRPASEKLSLPRPLTLLPAPPSPPPPELLPSDDEGSAPVIPITLRGIPHYYPKLPPKHTYLRTPVRASLSLVILASLLICFVCVAITSKETGASHSGEEVEECESGPGVTEEPPDCDGGYEWTR